MKKILLGVLFCSLIFAAAVVLEKLLADPNFMLKQFSENISVDETQDISFDNGVGVFSFRKKLPVYTFTPDESTEYTFTVTDLTVNNDVSQLFSDMLQVSIVAPLIAFQQLPSFNGDAFSDVCRGMILLPVSVSYKLPDSIYRFRLHLRCPSFLCNALHRAFREQDFRFLRIGESGFLLPIVGNLSQKSSIRSDSQTSA